MKQIKCLVTGGAGFIGSHIVEDLIEQGHKVRVIDDLSTGKMENLDEFKDSVDFVKADIRDYDAIQKAFDGIEYVFHQAALRSVPKSCDDPVSTNEVNVTGTINVLMAAKDHKVKRVVYASSSSAYGDSEVIPQSEDQTPMPISPYAVSKLTGEYYCRVFYKIYGLQTVSLRYFNVFGPRQDIHSKYAAVIPNFLLKMFKNEKPEVHGDGLQSRDFTYVKNVSGANIHAAFDPGISGMSINVAMGKPHTVLELLENLNKILGTKCEPEFTPPRKGDVRQTWADVTRLSAIMDLDKAVNFQEGLKQTTEWFKARYA